jgi:hypothetical protein
MEALYSSETSVLTQRTTRRHIPEDNTLPNHWCENLKPYTILSLFIFLSLPKEREQSDRVLFYVCTREVLGWNLGRDEDYPEWCSSCFSSVPIGRDGTFNLGCSRFLPHPFQHIHWHPIIRRCIVQGVPRKTGPTHCLIYILEKNKT